MTRSGLAPTRNFGPPIGGPKRPALQVLLFLLLLAATPVFAQDTHLLMITGVGGDDEHATNFHKWAGVQAAKDKGGLTDATITYLGDKPT
jgi:hypothetical protein